VIGSRVAIKFLPSAVRHDRKIVDRFFNEARAVNVIGHDNILKILDLDVTEDNRHYFVMEFLNGKPLPGPGGSRHPGAAAGRRADPPASLRGAAGGPRPRNHPTGT